MTDEVQWSVPEDMDPALAAFVEGFGNVLVHRFKMYCETPAWHVLKRHNLKRRVLAIYTKGIEAAQEAGLGPIEVNLTQTVRPKWLPQGPQA